MKDYTAEEIFSHIDHTLLKQTATKAEIKALCDEGMKYGTATVCIPPCFVKAAKEYTGGKLGICTVIGFPNGNSTTESKVFEASDAVANGADEIDMVINISLLKEKNITAAVEEINAVKATCRGKILKVIIETCLLDYDEKLCACKAVSMSGADYIKTSTGFSSGGATLEDVRLLAENCKGKKVKAAGGIKSVEDAVDFLNAGAERLGTSSLVKMLAKI